MKLPKRTLGTLLAAPIFCLAADDLPPIPPTPKNPVTNEYQGIQVVDDYRWLEASADPAVRQEFANTGGRSRGSTPEELRAFVASERAKWAAAVKTAGIQPE